MIIRLFVFLFCMLAALAAQTSTSSISGTITDPTGAIIPGAGVTLTSEETGVISRQTATEAGVYSFPALPVGSYTVTVEQKGFKTARRVKNVLAVATPSTVDVVLEVGDTVEVVTVEAAAEQLQTSNATIGSVVTEKAIVELPLNGRNPLNLLVLEPGVVQRSAGALGTGVHVNGSRDMSSNVTIDGIDANEGSVPGATKNVYRINPDNIREYKVTTSNATAEEGRNSGASVSVATRSGTNEFHGTIFEFFRNTALNANEFFSNALGNPKPDIKLNQYGVEIGGPIRKNRTFFFASWQGQKINFSQPVDQTFGEPPDLYTPSARAGVFRYWVSDPSTPFTLDGQRITRNTPLLVDRFSGQLRPEVRTCGSPTDTNCVASYNFAADDPRRLGVDPTVRQLLDKLPLPNSYQTGDGLNTAAYFWNTPTKVRGPSWLVRIDHNFNEKHSLFGRYLHGQQDTIGGDPNNGRPQLYPGFPPLGEVFRSSRNLAVGLRSVLGPRVVNEMTLGFGRFGYLFTKGEANPEFLNLPAYARTNGTGATNGFNNVDPGVLNNPRTYRAVTTPQVVENLTIISGS
ncbi:MAG TPA: carboxypeptidase regulatory-like domain-containing protein, partial [Bryobacteraceae bacterium]|nr:carboxypeptidase regulatory-like domain-containing protein [Bryobacteraceae bacterium]